MTDTTFKFYDENGVLWIWVYICPYCGDELATMRLIDLMGLDGDDIIGCDACRRDVPVDDAQTVLIDTDGNRA